MSPSPWIDLRAEFLLPPWQIYLDGNSLGPASRPALQAIEKVLGAWKTKAIDGWNDAGWIDLAERGAKLLAPLIGATPASIVVTGQTTANLHQILATIYEPQHPTRRQLVGDVLNFTSDRYALESHLRLRGNDPATHLDLVPSRDGYTLETADILAAVTDATQGVILPSVLFSSGQLLDVVGLTRAIRDRGAWVVWDLAHSIGAVPHTLGTEDGPDAAFWCNYKWLNAGPGAPGGIFLHPRHHGRPPGMAGWWGVQPERRFASSPQHEPASGAAALHMSTPSIFSLAPLLGTLKLFERAGGIEAVRARSLELTSKIFAAVDATLAKFGISTVTPREIAQRGGHVALRHPEAWRICQALKATGVTPDFRAPDIIRLAPAAFYTMPEEVDDALVRLRSILATKAYEVYPDSQPLVP